MWHVADGDLHAYLDGALGAYPAEEADRIREHLERCEECRERLGAEERVRERAGGVLARTGVETLEPPPFEEIRKRARARAVQSTGSGPGRLGWLGWAASVVLALGTGWMLGHRPEAVLRERVAVPPVPVEAEREVDAVGSAFADGPAPPAEPTDLAGAAIAAAERSEELRADEEPEGERESAGAAATTEGSAPAAALGVTEAPAPTARATSDAVAARRDVRMEDQAPDRVAPIDMVLPGWSVVQVRWTEFMPGVGGLSVRQRMDQDTATVDLRFLGLDRRARIPTGEPSVLFGPLPDGVHQVIVSLGDESGWAALRGRLPRERLQELLDLLR